MNRPEASARQRALLILQVQTGQITATAAAQQLGLSRKSYYQWEKRALEALIQSQEPQAPGRPRKASDPEKEQLRQQVTQLEEHIHQLEQVLELRQVVQKLPGSGAKKNSRSCRPSSNKQPPPGPSAG